MIIHPVVAQIVYKRRATHNEFRQTFSTSGGLDHPEETAFAVGTGPWKNAGSILQHHFLTRTVRRRCASSILSPWIPPTLKITI